MEISSSAVAGGMRVGLQIVSSHKTPRLEIYHQLRNSFGPEKEALIPNGVDEKDKRLIKTRFHEIFIEFTLVNIGGERAENVKLSLSGDLKRNSDKPMGEVFNNIIPQMAPGQVQFLFSFSNHDLLYYPEGKGKSDGFKKQSLTINIEYDAPSGFINNLIARYYKYKNKSRFETSYTFTPQLIDGDLPAAEYN
jgi:hypothetical protein